MVGTAMFAIKSSVRKIPESRCQTSKHGGYADACEGEVSKEGTVPCAG